MKAVFENLEKSGLDRKWFVGLIQAQLDGGMDGMLKALAEKLPDGAAAIQALTSTRPEGLDAVGVARWTMFLQHARDRWKPGAILPAYESLRPEPWRCPSLEVSVSVSAELDKDLQRPGKTSDFGDLLLLPWVACVDSLVTDGHIADQYRATKPRGIRGRLYPRRELPRMLDRILAST